jgi:hypothetical protein
MPSLNGIRYLERSVTVSHIELSVRTVDGIDPRLQDFIEHKVNTFVKWDLVRFFHDNPATAEPSECIALATGRDESSIAPELAELTSSGILSTAVSADGWTVYALTEDRGIRHLINTFILACDDRNFRTRAVYDVLRGLRQRV